MKYLYVYFDGSTEQHESFPNDEDLGAACNGELIVFRWNEKQKRFEQLAVTEAVPDAPEDPEEDLEVEDEPSFDTEWEAI